MAQKQNVWQAQQDYNLKIDRDSFDWTHSNNFSAEFGTIYPLFTRLMPQNSKVTIDPDLGLQLLPMSFPVQTPMKAKFSWYKVPLRTLWDDYMDYVGNFKQGLEEPYHDIPDHKFEKFYGDCQLADYIDIPNVLYGKFGSLGSSEFPFKSDLQGLVPLRFYDNNGSYSSVLRGAQLDTTFQRVPQNLYDSNTFTIPVGRVYDITNPIVPGIEYSLKNILNLPVLFKIAHFPDENSLYRVISFSLNLSFLDDNNVVLYNFIIANSNGVFIPYSEDNPLTDPNTNTFQLAFTPDATFTLPTSDVNLSNSRKVVISVTADIVFNDLANDKDVIIDESFLNSLTTLSNNNNEVVMPLDIVFSQVGDDDNAQWSLITPATSPYYSSQSNPTGKKLKAYRARAYEAIYNAYIRDSRNNPLLDEQGNPVYNKWLLNKSGGADTYAYELHRDNWEKDFLTTAVQSPQQGVAPLVGLTQYISDTDEGLAYKLSLVDEDGNKYAVNYSVAEDNGVKSYTISVGDKLDGVNVLEINPKQAIDNTNYGISILDFRMVNAYQKYLELNIRKGYSYKDIIEGRFDCKVRFDELQMPEYLGGFTRDIQMNRVVQSVDNNVGLSASERTYERSLGSLGGDAFLNTPNAQPITCFCDEECIIMGILRVVPLPVYSQLLPKDFLYNDILDHFNPEFDNIGMQPITYAEVCPLQAKAFGVSLDDTFGYQRAWYEYIYANDTSHGLMRTYFRDFLMNRHFRELPRLNKSFLLVDPQQVNDVFQVRDSTHVIIGQAVFRTTTELPISRVSIPRID